MSRAATTFPRTQGVSIASIRKPDVKRKAEKNLESPQKRSKLAVPSDDEDEPVKLVVKKDYKIHLATPNATFVAAVAVITHTFLLLDVPFNQRISVHRTEALPEDLKDKKLSEVYHVGQSVVAKMLPPRSHGKQSNCATLLPSVLNAEFNWPPVRNQMIPVTVKSIEDHGFYANLHVPKAQSYKCFVKTERRPKLVNSIEYVWVDAVKNEAKLVACRGFADSLGRYIGISAAMDAGSLVAGQLVEASVKSVVFYETDSNISKQILEPIKERTDPLASLFSYPLRALELGFGQTLEGIVLNPHLHQPQLTSLPDKSPEEQKAILGKSLTPYYPYRINPDLVRLTEGAEMVASLDKKKKKEKAAKQEVWPRRCPSFNAGVKCLARVIAVLPGDNGPKVVLSILPHLVYWTPDNVYKKLQTVPRGTTFESAKIAQCTSHFGVRLFVSVGKEAVDPSLSVYSKVSTWKLSGPLETTLMQVPHERIADEKPELEILKLQVGQKISARAFNFNMVDAQMIGGMGKKFLKEKFVDAGQVEIGDEVEGEVCGIAKDCINFRLSSFVQGRAFVQQLSDSGSTLFDAKTYKFGTKHKLRVIETDPAKGTISLTAKKTLRSVSVDKAKRWAEKDYALNEIVKGYVLKHMPTGLVIGGYGGSVGFLSYVDIIATTSDDKIDRKQDATPQQVKAVQSNKRFREGASLQVRIEKIRIDKDGPREKSIILSIDLDRKALEPQKAPQGERPPLSIRRMPGCALPFEVDPDNLEEAVTKALELFPVGTEIDGKIVNVHQAYNTIQIAIWGRLRVLLHMTETSDNLSGRPIENFATGNDISVMIKGPAPIPSSSPLTGHLLLEGTLREGSPLPQSVDELVVTRKYSGVISNSGPKGVFVYLSSRVFVQIRLDQLGSSKKVDEARANNTLASVVSKLFPQGKVLKGIRILNVNTTKGLATGSLMDEQLSAALTSLSDMTDLVTYDSMSVGDKLPARYKFSMAAGAIVTFENSASLDALCPNDELSDGGAIPTFTKGDLVLVKVLKKIDGMNRIVVGMKPSYFDDVDVQQATAKVNQVAAEEEEEDVIESPSEDESEEDEMGDEEVAPLQIEEDSDEEEVLSSGEEPDAPLVVTSRDWLEDASDNDTEIGKEKWEEKLKTMSSKKSSLKKAAASVAEFEKQLTLAPNDSAGFIKYMAYLVQLSDLEKAREIAMRGIHTIDLSRNKDRQAIWFALLNMENRFGDTQSLLKTLNEALQYNDPKDVYLHMVSVFESCGKWTELDALCEKMLKKCGRSLECWISYLTSLYVRDTKTQELSDFASGRKKPSTLSTRKDIDAALKKAQQRLEPKQLVELDTVVARLECKFGSAEAGRSKFLRVLSEHPKRNDIWGHLFDAQLGVIRRSDNKSVEIATCRTLFQQAATIAFKPHKMKSIFTKWLAFEKHYGSRETMKACQDQAKQYVESRTAN